MYWNLQLVMAMEDAPWPATKSELIGYVLRNGLPKLAYDNLMELADDGEYYDSLDELAYDIPSFGDGLYSDEY